EVELTVDKAPATPGDPVFEVKNLTLLDSVGRVLLDDISFDIHEGEILAVAGVQGNGQTELTESILGLRDHLLGSIRLHDRELARASVRDVLESGVGYVPEDRKKDGLVAE